MHRRGLAIPLAHGRFWSVLITSVLVAVLLAACGTSSGATQSLLVAPSLHPGASAHIKTGGTVVIDNVSGSLWTCGFNPYSPTDTMLSAGILYEPL
ncbi:MAG TPA: hypothetical protein VF221_09390, partial [Chloroflexota bacterium]